MKIIRKLLHLCVFVANISPVQNESAERCIAAFPEVFQRHGNIGGSVNGHVLSGGQDIYSIGVSAAHRHGKTAADNITEHIIKDNIRLKYVISTVRLQLIQRRNDASPRAPASGRWASGFHTDYAAFADADHVLQLKRRLLPYKIQHGGQSFPPSEQRG